MKLKDIKLVTGDDGFGGTSRLWRFSVVITLACLVIYIVGFSTDWWAQLDNEDFAPITGAKINAHFGLWRKCITISLNQSGKIEDGCEDMDNDEDYKPAAKTLCSIGLILGILGLPISILAGCGQSHRGMAFGAIVTIIAGAAAVIGAAVFIGKAKDNDDRLDVDYSTFLALIGAVLVFLGGIFQLLTIKSEYLTIA